MGQQIHLALSQSAHRVLSRLASFLPGILALLIAIVVLASLGLLFAWLARRILAAFTSTSALAATPRRKAPPRAFPSGPQPTRQRC